MSSNFEYSALLKLWFFDKSRDNETPPSAAKKSIGGSGCYFAPQRKITTTPSSKFLRRQQPPFLNHSLLRLVGGICQRTKIILQFSPLRGENCRSFEGEMDLFRALGSKQIHFPLELPFLPELRNLSRRRETSVGRAVMLIFSRVTSLFNIPNETNCSFVNLPK